MTYIGLILEIIILILAVFGYLFSRGSFSSPDPEVRKKADAFRSQNGWWIRIGCLMIIALMSIEIFLHFQDIFS
jgi:magnesium-transporting ATPase (P-type)